MHTLQQKAQIAVLQHSLLDASKNFGKAMRFGLNEQVKKDFSDEIRKIRKEIKALKSIWSS